MNVVIIGNGVTGVSAAIRIRQLQPDWKITMISGESEYHYSRPALMYIFMGHMGYKNTKPYENSFWPKNDIHLIRDWVTEIDTGSKRLLMQKLDPIYYDKLLIATGSKSNKFGWPGQDLKGVQSLYDLMDLRELYENTQEVKNAVIVGGGLIGIELAEMLHSRGLHVTFLVREKSYWDNVLPAEESSMINNLIKQENMELLLERELKEIIDDGNGRVGGVITNKGEKIDCGLVGLTAGVSPNLDLIKESNIPGGRGILVDGGLRTQIEDIYSAGDCAEIVTEGEGRNLIQQVWYTGKMQGKVVGETIAGMDSVYDPGIWYNSAKFLNLEYQTYGQVNNAQGLLSIPGEKNLYWEHQNHLHSLRLVHNGNEILGVNVMGLRYSHKICESWVRDKRTPDYVLDNLFQANFDPEFFKRYESNIVGTLKEQII
ncbi:MAG: FAD-dependent oxidoreductase [Thermodesulfobacteriota bacterium]|nr:MAG: FAD-dependent oxidoreductase [Thermodesulfobacteriota bacterium]